jgi:putative oxidoreductase
MKSNNTLMKSNGALATVQSIYDYVHLALWATLAAFVLFFLVYTLPRALLGLAFVVVAFATAHRYWEFPEAAQNLQYAFLSKDLAIAGGLLVLFVTGAGRFSVDNAMSS